MVGEIKVIQGPTGFFVSFPVKMKREGSDRQLAYPANAENRIMWSMRNRWRKGTERQQRNLYISN